jgi:hypothetical protein
MTKDNLSKAQDGTSIPLSSTPKLDEGFMERKYGSYPGPRSIEPIPYINTGSIPNVSSGNQPSSSLANLLNFSSGKDESKGGRTRRLSEFAENRNGRYDFFMPGEFDNEDAYGQQQSFGSKMVNGVGKGLLLTGTTFLQSTVGLVNGTMKAINDGKFSSFYNNDFNNKLDEINKAAEDALPNYYTVGERDANWYSPSYWMTGNFLWDGVVKNLGFAAGASLSGGVYTQALKSLPYASRLFSVGKASETLAATEAGLLGANKVADTYGKVRALSDKFLSNYNTLNPAGRIVVAGLATTGEAGIEALHSSNEFRKELIDAHIAKFGVEPTGLVLEEINDATEGAGNATFFANVGLLTATNYIQFPKILGSTYKGEKGIIDGLVREVDDIVFEGGKYVKPTSKYPKISALNKIRPYTFSTSEAFEEVSQYSATVATQDYYNKKRNGEATSWLDSAVVGITEGAFSEEGAKNALIGGISGALMQGRGRFIQDRAKKKNTASLVETLNNTKLSDFTKETIDSVNRGTVLQQEREQAVKNGDILNSKDLEADYVINYLTPRIKYGRYDLVKADIKEYSKLASTEEGFAQLQAEGKALQTDTREAYIERLNKLGQTADNVKSLWQSLNLRYSGQVDENGKPIYSNDIINKMIYAATKVADYDQRIPELSAPLMTVGINTKDVIQSLINGDVETFNEAVNTIKNLDVISERKDQLGEQLDDLAEISLRRQDFLKAYTDIKENPNKYKEAPIKTEQSTEPIKTVKVKTKKGEVDIEIGTVYFAGKGIDYSKDPINSPVPISQFIVEEINEDGTLKIRNTDTDIVKDIKVEEFENLKVGKYDTLKENKTANYFYNHRNDIFEFNFGKNFGGKKQGRLEYQDGKLYFVYITPKGKVSKKELNNSHFIIQEGFNKPIISKVGNIENEQQKESRESFLSPEEIAIQKTTLAKNRESRLEVLSQLGEESKENLSEIEKKLSKQNEELVKIKEDLQNIEKMKKEGPNGVKIKLNFSKATRSFTQALNKLTKMQSDIETEIENLNSQKEELEMNISYFQDFANQITEMPEDSGDFLRELKDQVALLVDNGKNLNNTLAAAKRMVKSVNAAIKTAAGLFRKTLKSTYIVDEDYSQYLSDLLDQVVSGENVELTWPLLKQEMANFALTSDLSREATVDEPTLLKSIEEVKQIEKDLAELRAEYKARKIILDRFQNIINEYNAKKEQEEKVTQRFNKISNTAYKGPSTNSFDTRYEPESKKSNDIIYRATTEFYEGKPHQIRSNQFGLDLDKFKNRNSIRGIFITSKTQDQLLPGVIELMLDNDPSLIDKYKDSMIVMVMVDESGSVVGVDGKPIPEGKDLLENAIFQAMPESGFRNGNMFREDTSEEVKDAINKQYNKIRSEILSQTILGVPQEIEASFGVPQFEKDAAGNKIYTTRTSVQSAGLVNESDLKEDLVLFVPTTNTNVSKGTVNYTTPLGSVFLDLPNGRLKLKNRLHTKQEATAIFDSILQLSKNIINSEEGISSDSSVRILEFLKGLTYWGIPVNNVGNNSVFFKNVKLEDNSAISFSKNMLVIGSEEISFGFTPTELQASKELIISELEKIYNNVNAFKVNDIGRSFEQITSISSDGEIQSIIWPNYQSYLLSDKKPNGSKREDFELPLFTLMKPKLEGEFNREGIYFYTTNTVDNFEIPQPKSQPSNIPIQQKINYIIDGVTTNTYTSPQGKKILFIASPNTTKDNYQTSIQILQGGDLAEVVKTIEDANKDYKQVIKQTIYNAISPQLIKNKAEEEYEMQFKIPDEEVISVSEEDTVKDNNAQSIIDSLEDQINSALSDINSEDLRVKINEELSRVDPENWNKVESWLKQNFPNVPVYRVKNIIQATNGRQAWGMFKDGAIYVYENAETGTAYHEVFEAVWKMFTSSEEQVDIINEFKTRKGTFVDRPTGATVKYSEATPSQIKEQLAEEFRDFIEKKSKPEGLKSKIGKLFRDLKRFIENALLGNNSQKFTNELFERIGSGYYKKHMPYATQLSMAQKGIIDIEDAFATSDSEFRLKTLNDRQTSDTIQEMTFLMLSNLVKDDRSLFEIADKINQKDFYKDLLPKVLATVHNKEILVNTIIKNNPNISKEQKDALAIIIANNRQLERDIVSDWSRITEKHKEYIKAYNITFDENDELQLSDEDKIKESNKFDASKIDSFRKANTAIKLLLATNPIIDNNGKATLSTINGRLLNPVSKMYITLMNKLYTSTSIEDMINRLQQMAIEDPTYEMLFKRITKKTVLTGDVDFSQIKSKHSAQLLSGLWKTFKKQSPDVKNVFIFNDGDIVVGDATLSSSASQLRNEYIRSITIKAKAGNGYFNYNEKENAYVPNRKKLESVKLTNLKQRLDFLSSLGIPFNSNEYNKLSKSNKDQFIKTVDGIKKSIEDTKKIVSFSTKSLSITGRLLEIGILKTAASNPEFSSTYFNISGERVQNFIGTNAVSDLHNTLINIENINDLAGTQYAYLLTDVFSKNSNLLSRIFKEDGTKKSNANELLKPGYVGGIINEEKGKASSSSTLSQKQRLVQELNLNIEGYYLNLVPGDASLEHNLYMGNPISSNSLSRGLVDVNEIFKGYFLSELELSREDRPIPKIEYKEDTPEFEKRKTTDLRFFKGIFGEKLHNDVITTEGSPEEVYNIFENKINQAISNYIKSDILRLQSYLDRFNILKVEDENKFTLENVGLPIQMSISELNRQLTALSINYMIANIEMHKIIYSDPYQYSDELKRIKSFLSPRQAIISNSPIMNVILNKVWNEEFEKGDIGYTEFTQDYMRTVSHQDIVGVIDIPNYDSFEETDGGGIISYKAYRNFRIRASDWNENEEKQFRYDVAYEKRDKGLTLSPNELKILDEKNPQVKSAYTPLKPIVSGSKLDSNGNPSLYNNIVLDKYALYPLSYRIIKEINSEANAIKLYDKMQSENIDYIVFESGRKVGSEKSHATYNEDGSFNTNEYENIVNVPLSIMSVQSEVPSKEVALVTRGSQVTKLITMDYLDNGVPVDFMNNIQSVNFNQRYEAWNKLSEKEKLDKSPLYKEIVNNQNLLQELTNEGFETILRKLGIVEEDGKLIVKDFSEATKTLRDELFKREINDNISDALSAFLEGESIIEATPAYQTIRNVLYSIVDKEIVSPKISGGMKVQIPSSLFESNRVAQTEINGKKGYTSDILKFYEDADGKRVMEVMVGRWFKSDMSDKELIKYLNETPEGQKILSGIAFRIPTQSQNSIDAIRIKQFLPKEFGDSVVVPAAIVKKVGSDFDIDKLSMYFKNVYSENGKIKLVPFYGFGKQAKDKFASMFDSGVLFNKEQRKELEDLKKLKEYEISGIFDTGEGKRFDSLFESLGISNDEDALSIFLSELQELGVKDAIVNKLYKQSLENEFIQSSENLITNPLNFDKLITPNSADQLKDISKTVVERVVGSSFDYTDVNNMLDRRYMSRLRHAFVSGKRAIGVAAVNQTNQSLNQRTTIIIDKNRMDRVQEEDSQWLGNSEINFENYNKVVINGQEYPTLSGVTNIEGQRITNILGQFIDGYVDISKDPWIMEMGATPNVASTFMFLVKLGIPVDTVAYFMNQPMIREYIQSIENEGYSFLFIDNYIEKIKSEYLKTEDVASYIKDKKDKNKWPNKIPNKSTLLNSLGKTEFTQDERDQQVFMFDEFLKYVKMADQLYTVTQGSNWDTSNFNDSFLVYKKNVQYNQAKNTILASYDPQTNTLISAVDGLLNNSFIGNLAEKINDSKDALSNFLISDKGNVQSVLNNVLAPYVSLPNKTFVKVARKAVNDLFDWAVQTDQGLNLQLQETLLSNKGVASEVLSFIDNIKKDDKDSLFNNQIINLLEVRPSLKEGEKTPNNLSLKNTDNKVYDQNNIIYAFRELKEALKDKNDLYDKIVMLSILQSGLNNSPISFTSLIPYEDFAKIYNKTLLRIENIANLNDFYELGIFQRNNWSDDDIVPQIKLFSMFSQERGIQYPSVDFLPNNVKKDINNKEIPQVITQRTGSRIGNGEYIVASWNKNLSRTEIAEMRRAGDYSYVNKGLFKKVYDADGDPLINIDKKKNRYFVYKAINAWGDSFRANEFYAEAKQSIIDNGIMKVNEVIDDQVVASFENNVKTTRTPSTDASSGALFTKKGNQYTLADGKTYTADDINSEMLIAMGYSQQRVGQIINIKCKG